MKSVQAPGLTPQRLTWSAAVVLGASLLHWPHLPAWIPLLLVACLCWRLAGAWAGWPLPPRTLRLGLAFLAFLAVLTQYRTLNGLEAGSALLVLMVALKFMEARSQRDQLVIMMIAYFLMFASLLHERGLLAMIYLVVFVWVTTVGLLQLARRGPLLPSRPTARLAGRMLLKALPIMVVLFVLFPRVPGPLWGMPAATGAALTGLSEQMSPGDITELGLSDEVVFRVEFSGTAPPAERLYWRGPVLRDFDGRTWTRPSAARPLEAGAIEYLGGPVEYRVRLEPQRRNWVFALDVPRTWSTDHALRLGADYQLRAVSFAPVRSHLDYVVTSYTEYRANRQLSPLEETRHLRLPVNTSPRTRELIDRWRADGEDPRRLVGRALAYFRDNEFHYTMTPPALGEEPVDEFLFGTREGFCEHYASAFTVMMRLAGIPARVVTGYQGGERNPLGDYYIVRQANAHAWSEVWLTGEGWVRVDPTGAVSPERITLGSARAALGEGAGAGTGLARQWAHNLTLAWDAVNAHWARWVMAYGPELQQALLRWLGFERPGLAWLAAVAAVAIVFCLILLGTMPAWRDRRRAAPDEATRSFALFCRRLNRAGTPPRRPSEAPAAFARRAKTRLPHHRGEIDTILETYLRARYEPDENGAELQRLRQLVSGFRPRPTA